MKRRLIACATALLVLPALASADCVVLLHGLARGENSLLALEASLTAQGFTVINQGYPSTEAAIGTLVEENVIPAVAVCQKVPVHFVTHSMGGILTRATQVRQLIA